MAAARAPYIDQSQSLNLFMASPTIGKLSSMYLYAWKAGLKTTYYLRSRPATRIQQATVAVAGATADRRPSTTTRPVACSLENPETLRGLPVTVTDHASRRAAGRPRARQQLACSTRAWT